MNKQCKFLFGFGISVILIAAWIIKSDTLILFFTSSNGIDLVIQLIATLIGVFVAFVAAMTWDRKKKEDEIRQTRNQMIDSIITELEGLLIGYDDPKRTDDPAKWNKETNEFKGYYGLASIPVFESAVNSGNLLSLSLPLQNKLTVLYHRIEHYNSFIEQMLRFYSTPIYTHSLAEREANKLIAHVNKLMPQWANEIKEVLPELKSEKKS